MKFVVLATAAAALVAAVPVQANLYKFTFTDTISAATTPGIDVGDTITLALFADNGGTTSVNQTWNLSDLQGFTIKAGTYSATYSKVFEFPATGNFVTDATGTLVTTQFYGTSTASNDTDNFGSLTGDIVFGDASFLDTVGRGNQVAANTFTNPGSWTVSAAGVPEPASWALMIAGFGVVGVVARRERRHRVVAA